MLKDNVSISIELAKQWCRIDPTDTSEDNTVHKLIDGACNKAQRYMNNEFTVGEVPADVEIWILKQVAKDYENRIPGVTSENIGGTSTSHSEDEEQKEMEKALLPYREFVGF